MKLVYAGEFETCRTQLNMNRAVTCRLLTQWHDHSASFGLDRVVRLRKRLYELNNRWNVVELQADATNQLSPYVSSNSENAHYRKSGSTCGRDRWCGRDRTKSNLQLTINVHWQEITYSTAVVEIRREVLWNLSVSLADAVGLEK